MFLQRCIINAIICNKFAYNCGSFHTQDRVCTIALHSHVCLFDDRPVFPVIQGKLIFSMQLNIFI